MAITEADYLQLIQNLTSLDRRRAVLESQELARKQTRQELEEELKKTGVDLKDVPGEIARLEALVEKDFSELKARVSEFERSMNEAEVLPPAPPPSSPVPQAGAVDFT